MQPEPRICMFCHDGLPVVQDQPVSLAWMDHIGRRDDCREAFEAWTDNMQADFKGD